MRTVYLLRHGERLDYVDRDWMKKTGSTSADDPPLADKGRTQAIEVGRRFNAERIKIDHVFSSPFQRCVETAQILLDQTSELNENLRINLEPGICEVLCDFPPGYLSPEQLKSRFNRVDVGYKPALIPRARESSDSKCFPRVRKSLKTILTKFNGDNLLFVGHGASLRGSCAALSENDAYQGLCTLSKFQKQDGVQGGVLDGWKAIFIGDDTHLSDKSNLRPY